jgi:type II secretory pathway component PulF
MIQAEIKLAEALSVLTVQASDPKFAQVLQNIRDQLLSGESLTEGLKEYPEWFDAIYVAMVHVGEATGNLGRSLGLLSTYIGKRQRLEAKIKSAMTYPAVLVVICVLVTVILMTFVVPKLTKIITSSGREMPGVTQFLMDLSDFLTGYWWAILFALALFSWIFNRIMASPKGRLAFDKFLLKIPIIGELVRQSVVARFASTLAALIRSGMPMADSLNVVAGVTGNAVMATAVRAARERIIGGADVATPLRESKVVDSATAHMIAVGEKTGELEKMLLTIGDSLEESTDISILRLSALIEPVIIVFMACIVGFIIYAVLLPILQVADISKM